MAEIEIWCQSEKSPKFIWFQFVHHRRPQRPTNWSVYNLALNSHSPSQDDHISSVSEIRSLLWSSQSKSALFTFRGCGGSLNHSRLLLFKASLVSQLQLPILETALLIITSPPPSWSRPHICHFFSTNVLLGSIFSTWKRVNCSKNFATKQRE